MLLNIIGQFSNVDEIRDWCKEHKIVVLLTFILVQFMQVVLQIKERLSHILVLFVLLKIIIDFGHLIMIDM